MAIGTGSRVALKTLGTNLLIGQLTAQPPVFGVSESASTPFAIDWDNGSHVAAVPAAVLDEIVAADAATLLLLGKVVCPDNYSSSYNAVVVGAYNRNGTQECVLLKTLQNGAYIEYAATSVTAVPGL